MSFLSQTGHVGIKTQASKGTYADPGAVAPDQGVFIRTRSGALGGNRDLMIPDPEIGGSRDIPGAALGPVSFSGEYSFYARNEELATLAYAALGTKAADTGTALLGYTHTITPADTLPWLSVEEQIGNTFEVFKYTDAKVNTLHLESDANGYLTGTVGLVALTQALTTATSTGNRRVDTSPLLVGSNITVTWGGASLPARSFHIDVNNNLETDDFRLGSLFLGNIAEKRRELTIGCTIRPQDSALWRTAMWGGPTATVAGGTTTAAAVVITITSYEDIPGANAGVKYTTTITVPSAIIAPFNMSPSGDDVLQNDIEIRPIRPNPGTDIVSVAIKNSYATVA